MRKVKFLLLSTLVGLSLICLIMLFRSGGIAYDPRQIIDSMPQNVDMQLSGVNFTEVTGNRKEWTLEAATLHYLREENLMVFNQVKAVFYGHKGQVRISGTQGFYHRESKNVRLTGEVKAVDSDGNLLTSNELDYNVDTKVLSAPGEFLLKGPQIDLRGTGLSIDTNTKTVKVRGRPTLVIKSPGNLL